MVQKPPNILLLTAHDLGRFLGCYGIETVDTPNLDGLAAEGRRFDAAYCVSPVCSPSRGAQLTGLYPQTNGLMGLTHSPFWWSLNEPEQHLSHRLREAGYATALFNFQHEALDARELGFDERPMEAAPGAPTHRPASEVADALVPWLAERSNADRPFYAQAGFFETHTPYDFGGVAPDASKGHTLPETLIDDADGRAWMAGLQGAARELDAQIGRILAALDEGGLREDTIVIFCADHGLEVPRGKWTLYDQGVEIAFLARWPGGGVSGGAAYEALYSQIDFLPTLYDWLGLAGDPAWPGVSHAPCLRGDGPPPRDRVFLGFEGENSSRGVRTESRKLIQNFKELRCLRDPGLAGQKTRTGQPLPFVECYDLAADPLERDCLDPGAPENAPFRELHRSLADWMHACGDPLPEGPVPTPYYRRSRDLLPQAYSGGT